MAHNPSPHDEPEADLELIPGDTYAVREELKLLGGVWSASERAWHIAPEKLPLARAIVENQSLAPSVTTTHSDVSELADPFEEDSSGPAMVTLGKNDGDTYAAREALKVIGAQWDKQRRTWTIREERAPYARAIIASVSGTAPASDSEEAPKREHSTPSRKPSPPRETRGGSAPSIPEPVPVASSPSVSAPVADAGRSAGPERIKLTGLWLNRSKEGQEYLTGRFSASVKILIFKNKYKQAGDNQPTHQMYLVPVDPESRDGGEQGDESPN